MKNSKNKLIQFGGQGKRRRETDNIINKWDNNDQNNNHDSNNQEILINNFQQEVDNLEQVMEEKEHNL